MTKQIKCPTRLIHPKAKAPDRGSEKAVGHDIYCVAGLIGIVPDKWSQAQLDAWKKFQDTGEVVLEPGQSFLFRTGFAQAIQEDHACFFWDRSGMGGSKCIHRLAGVIDEDYRGEWFVRLVNHSDQAHKIVPGDKIVQGVYQERIEAECPIVDTLEDTERGEDGFGSTDTGPEPVDEEDADTPQFETPSEGAEGEDLSPEDEEDADLADAAADVAGREDPRQPPGEIRYDGIDVEKAIACMSQGQIDSAARWIESDHHFFPNGIKVDPTTLRRVEDQNVVAFTAIQE